jgi:hypothetical protein
MRERLIENWLDNASERSYQPVFCQYLVNQGYTLIHSTRHCAAEHGKDIIAINPEGTPCAFQLKGNPNGRLNLTTFRQEIEPQLRALTHQAIQNPSVPLGRHLSYFVTNGRVEEEVSQAIDLTNRANESDGIPHRNVVVIARDQLLSNFKSLENGLWPSELEQTRVLLEILTTDGGDTFPLDRFHALLSDLLLLSKEAHFGSVADFNRRISSAALLTTICLDPFSRKGNHYSIITAWTMLSMYLISTTERWSKDSKQILNLLDITHEAIIKSMIALIEETSKRNGVLREGDPSTDYCTYAWRYTLLKVIFGIGVLLKIEDYADDTDELQRKIDIFLNSKEIKIDFGGQSSLPGILLLSWAELKRGNETTGRTLAGDILKHCVFKNPLPIYYTISEVIQDRLSEFLEDFDPVLKNGEDSNTRHSWFARQAFMNLFLMDEFRQCEQIWPTYSHFKTTEYHPKYAWEYCLVRSDEGQNIVFESEPSETWSNLELQVNQFEIKNLVPNLLIQRPWLLTLWLIICPQRAILPALKYLYEVYDLQKQD